MLLVLLLMLLMLMLLVLSLLPTPLLLVSPTAPGSLGTSEDDARRNISALGRDVCFRGGGFRGGVGTTQCDVPVA
jgi:hypothetical protein